MHCSDQTEWLLLAGLTSLGFVKPPGVPWAPWAASATLINAQAPCGNLKPSFVAKLPGSDSLFVTHTHTHTHE